MLKIKVLYKELIILTCLLSNYKVAINLLTYRPIILISSFQKNGFPYMWNSSHRIHMIQFQKNYTRIFSNLFHKRHYGE